MMACTLTSAVLSATCAQNCVQTTQSVRTFVPSETLTLLVRVDRVIGVPLSCTMSNHKHATNEGLADPSIDQF